MLFRSAKMMIARVVLVGIIAQTATCLSLAVGADDSSGAAVANPSWVSEGAIKALERAGQNRGELIKALEGVTEKQRSGMDFLVTHMPDEDLQALTAEFLVENVQLAYEARDRFRWGHEVPEEIFLNDVLPYVNINERRDRWRKELYEKCAPLVGDCTTSAEAAQRLNERLFGMINVRYSTQRRRADQGPKESMETGLASCTGLSILLSDACRAVGVPARLVGIPNWVNKRGNHTWVEVWDKGWHFTGAAEPSGEGLNHAWFEHDASLAIATDRRHSIFAASFRSTGETFPMVWARDDEGVPGVNVTHRYAKPQAGSEPATHTRLLVRVLDNAGKRVAAKVRVVDANQATDAREGMSRDEGFDTNDILVFELPHRHTFEVQATLGEQTAKQAYVTTNRTQDQIDIRLP